MRIDDCRAPSIHRVARSVSGPLDRSGQRGIHGLQYVTAYQRPGHVVACGGLASPSVARLGCWHSCGRAAVPYLLPHCACRPPNVLAASKSVMPRRPCIRANAFGVICSCHAKPAASPRDERHAAIRVELDRNLCMRRCPAAVQAWLPRLPLCNEHASASSLPLYNESKTGGAANMSLPVPQLAEAALPPWRRQGGMQGAAEACTAQGCTYSTVGAYEWRAHTKHKHIPDSRAWECGCTAATRL